MADKTTKTEIRRVPLADWHAEGARLFGEDRMAWRFRCPSCNHVALVSDWKAADAPEGAVAFSCIGRYTGSAAAAAEAAFKRNGGPCNYTSGGFFCINKLFVVTEDGKESPAFEFAPIEEQPNG